MLKKESNQIIVIIVLVGLLIFSIASLVGCGKQTVEESHGFPSGATNTMDLGNGWYSFEWSGHTFIHKVSGYRSCITQIK